MKEFRLYDMLSEIEPWLLENVGKGSVKMRLPILDSADDPWGEDQWQITFGKLYNTIKFRNPEHETLFLLRWL